MDPYANNDTALYVVLVLIVLWRLPSWGRAILAFLRDFRDFRAGR
jgi:hypothetical protein